MATRSNQPAYWQARRGGLSAYTGVATPGPRQARDAGRTWLLRMAMIGLAYLAGVHLAAEAGALPDDPAAGGLLGPACVGCHQAPEDDPPPPAGGLAAPERESLMRTFREMTP